MTSHNEYDQFTTGTDVAVAFGEQIRGKHVVITGVSPESLGGSLATTIAKHSPGHLILASRTQAKLDDVVNNIKQSSPHVRVDTIQLNLSSQASIRKAAEQVSGLTEHIDLLINNAAIMDPEHHFTEEGIEMQFGTNYVGHFLLTNLLLPELRSSPSRTSSPGATRVVNVSSQGYRLSPVRFHDYNFEGKAIPKDEEPPEWVPDHFRPKEGKPYSGFISYGQCKTANILFSLGLTERLREEGIISYAVHPGSIHTGLSRNLSPEDEAIIEKTGANWVTHDQGISTILVAALDPALSQNDKGVFLSACQLKKTLPHASDPALAGKLWELSEKLTGETFSGSRV